MTNAIDDGKKPVFRIILEKTMNEELEQLKRDSGVTIAEHMRRAMKYYLLFKEENGLINEIEMMRFLIDWQAKNRKKAKSVK